MSEAHLVVDAGNVLGESPIWDADAAAVWWVDVKASRLHRCRVDDGTLVSWELPAPAGCIARLDEGRVAVAFADRVAAFDPRTGELTTLHGLGPEPPGNRTNDGTVDRDGNFWVSTMDDAETARSGALYRVSPHSGAARRLDGLGIPNGLAFSPDGRTMYFTETLDRTIVAFPHDPETGRLGEARPFASIEHAFPDGAAVDAHGCLWVALWDGWRIARFTPSGDLDRAVTLPVQRPTKCVFGGPELDILFVTSARKGLGGVELAGQPLAGALFTVRIDVPGLPTPPFGEARR